MSKRINKKRLAKIILGFVFSFVFMSGWVYADSSRLVGKENKFHPQGWSVGDEISFKKGTTVTLNDIGEVISGTLDEDTFLYPQGWQRVIDDYYYVTDYSIDEGPCWRRACPFFARNTRIAIPGYHHLLFKGGSPVTFGKEGNVLEGTLAKEAVLRLVNDRYGFIPCKENTILTFYASGAVRTAVLAADTKLRPLAWEKVVPGADAAGFLKFKANKAVAFDENGQVLTGTLKEAVQLLTGDGSIQLFPFGSTVRFTAQGAERGECR